MTFSRVSSLPAPDGTKMGRPIIALPPAIHGDVPQQPAAEPAASIPLVSVMGDMLDGCMKHGDWFTARLLSRWIRAAEDAGNALPGWNSNAGYELAALNH
jgi:hypothetical protein